MNNRVIYTALGSLLMLPSFGAQTVDTAKKIVFIAVDDLNDWVGFLGGHPNTLTPNMDRLAKMGLVFENAYCAAPVSNASRAALLTGVRSSTSGVYGNAEKLRQSPALEEAVTLPRYFSQHGYQAKVRGKIFHHPMGERADPQSWDELKSCGGKGLNPVKEPGKQANGLITDTAGGSVMLDWAGVDVDEHLTNDYLNCAWAAEQILDPSDEKKFIACGVFRPHLPWYVPQKYFDRFPLESIQDPEYYEDDVLDLPKRALAMTGYNKLDHEYHVIKRSGMQKEAIRAYLACIAYADDCLGVLVDALENNPHKEETVIVFWGDHGWHLGEKMRYRKVSLWERSCRVPMIIVAPGVTRPGSRCQRVASLLDLYPTLVELAGLPANKANEGVSLVPWLERPSKPRNLAAITTLRQNEHSLRTERYRYIVYRDGSEELYDHKQDPNEWYNLAGKPAYKAVIRSLRKQLPMTNVASVADRK